MNDSLKHRLARPVTTATDSEPAADMSRKPLPRRIHVGMRLERSRWTSPLKRKLWAPRVGQCDDRPFAVAHALGSKQVWMRWRPFILPKRFPGEKGPRACDFPPFLSEKLIRTLCLRGESFRSSRLTLYTRHHGRFSPSATVIRPLCGRRWGLGATREPIWSAEQPRNLRTPM